MKKPRFISAILFGALFIVQLLSLQYVLIAGNITNVQTTFLFELAAMVVFALACVYNLRAKESLSVENKRAVAGAAILYLIFVGITCNFQVQMGSLSLSLFNSEWANSLTAGIIINVIKLAFYLAAVCFMLMEPKETQVSIEFEEALEAADLMSEEAASEINDVLDEKEQ